MVKLISWQRQLAFLLAALVVGQVAHAQSLSFDLPMEYRGQVVGQDRALPPRLFGSVDVLHNETAFREAAEADIGGPTLPIRLAGEFEQQEAIIVCCNDRYEDFASVFVDIVRRTRGRVNLIAIYDDDDVALRAIRDITDAGIVADHVWFLRVPLNTFWVRDFGPIVGRRGNHPTIVDFEYSSFREDDDNLPVVWSWMTECELNKLSLSLDGGNLLTNGTGLGITTTRFIDENRQRMQRTDQLLAWTKAQLGLSELIVLRPLNNEDTQHVDMFATFIDAHTIVIGQLDPRIDPENARILDENAQALQRIRMGDRQLRVVRMELPPRHDGVWYPYTNVIFANGLLLVPTFRGDDQRRLSRALATYQRILPKWEIQCVLTDDISSAGGSLHCTTMNLPFKALPGDTLPAVYLQRLLTLDSNP